MVTLLFHMMMQAFSALVCWLVPCLRCELASALSVRMAVCGRCCCLRHSSSPGVGDETLRDLDPTADEAERARTLPCVATGCCCWADGAL